MSIARLGRWQYATSTPLLPRAMSVLLLQCVLLRGNAASLVATSQLEPHRSEHMQLQEKSRPLVRREELGLSEPHRSIAGEEFSELERESKSESDDEAREGQEDLRDFPMAPQVVTPEEQRVRDVEANESSNANMDPDFSRRRTVNDESIAPPPPYPVDCTWNDWLPWRACSKTCGLGSRFRRRGFTAALDGGQPCFGKSSEEEDCTVVGCPVDCKWGSWSAWSPTVSCPSCGSESTLTRRREVEVNAEHGGLECEDKDLIVLEKVCPTIACPRNCTYEEWSAWSFCTLSCGAGTKERNRDKKDVGTQGGTACPANHVETVNCNAQSCPVDCEVNEWSTWSHCSKDCGGGELTRTRSGVILNQHGGQACPSLNETLACNTDDCVEVDE